MDNLQESTNTTVTKAYDNIGSVYYPRVKLSWGVDGTAVDTSGSNPLPVSFAGISAVSGTVSLAGTSSVAISGIVPISGSVGITGTVPVSLSGTQTVNLSGTPTINVGGTQQVNLATLLAGEDLVVGVIKVEQRFTPYFINSAGTTLIKNTSGFIHTLTVTGGSAGAITGYDSASGTSAIKLFDFDSTNTPETYTFDYEFSNGLVVVTGAATKLSLSKR